MNFELISNAKRKGFYSEYFRTDYADDFEQYLWMFELQCWLREKHGIHVCSDTDLTLSWIYTIQSLHPTASYTGNFLQSKHVYSTYEQALEEGLKQALELI